MKVQLEKYNPNWANVYNNIAHDIKQHLEFLNPVIEHIGSTAIANMTAKPIIDILVGVSNQDQLDKVVKPLTNHSYIYYEKFNSMMPYRRFFVKLKGKPESMFVPAVYTENDNIPNELNEYKLAHIHVLEHNSYHWKRHIAFREYLRKHSDIKNEYEKIKIHLSTLNWHDGNEYNSAKNDFMKQTEEKALEWFERQNSGC